MKIHLLTRVSASGACALVHEAEIPFVIPPGVILWGSRAFARDQVEPHEHAYVEAFAHVLTDAGAAPLPPEIPAQPIAEGGDGA